MNMPTMLLFVDSMLGFLHGRLPDSIILNLMKTYGFTLENFHDEEGKKWSDLISLKDDTMKLFSITYAACDDENKQNFRPFTATMKAKAKAKGRK